MQKRTGFLDEIDDAANPHPEEPAPEIDDAYDDPQHDNEPDDDAGHEQVAYDNPSASYSLDAMRWTNVLTAEGVSPDSAEMSTYYAGHPGGFQWRLIQGDDSQWNVEERGATPWEHRAGPFTSISLARGAAQDEAVAAASEDEDDFDDDDQVDAPLDQVDAIDAPDDAAPAPRAVVAAPMIPEAARGLLERLDEISANAYLSARERATIIVAAAALRTGVIPEEMQVDWA